MAFWNRRNSNDIINKPDKNQTVEVSEYSIWQLVTELRNLASSINFMYAEYDLMEQDTIIGAALQMYADNAVQRDNYSTKIIEVVADSPQLKKDLYSVLNRLNIESRLWNTAYNTAKYGNKYWKILLNKRGDDIESLEEIDDPSCVMDLYLKGEPVLYAYSEDDHNIQKSQDYEFYEHSAFIHFMIQSGKISDRIELQDNNNLDEVTGQPLLVKYQIKRGESMIEGIRAIYRILKALEDNLIASVIARGNYTEIVNIEVGDSNEIEAKKMVNRVKRLFDSHMSLDVREGQQKAGTYNQPRGFMDPIFNSVNNGKGAITHDVFGGEVEVQNIAHIDYFNKLKFSGLHITPSMLAFEENIPGNLDDGSGAMVQQDIRFAMYVKKLIVALIDGVTDLLNIWLTLRGRTSEVGKFQIKMAVPSAAEDLADLNELQARLDSIDHLTEIITKNAPGVNSAAVTQILLDEYIPNKQLLNKLNELIKEPINIANQETEVAKAEMDSTLRQLSRDEVAAEDMSVNRESKANLSGRGGISINEPTGTANKNSSDVKRGSDSSFSSTQTSRTTTKIVK